MKIFPFKIEIDKDIQPGQIHYCVYEFHIEWKHGYRTKKSKRLYEALFTHADDESSVTEALKNIQKRKYETLTKLVIKSKGLTGYYEIKEAKTA